MSSEDRIERYEDRVTRIEAKLDQIFAMMNSLSIAGVKNACPSPGACTGLSKELEHVIIAHNATMLRVERAELKTLEIERMMVSQFHKIEKQKAWVLGAWSVVAFCAAIVGAIGTIAINHMLKK